MRYAEKSKGEWVRDYLDEHGDAYVRELHEAHAEWCEEHDYDPPDYDSMRRTLYLLRRLGLVQESRRESADRGPFQRVYYEVVPGAEGAEAWERPTKAVYG